MKMSISNFSWRRSAVAIALLMLTCGTPTRAWCSNLWASFDHGGGIESYASGKLKKSGAPTPHFVDSYGDVSGLAFDKAQNLWAVVNDNKVVRFSKAELKNLNHDSTPIPDVIISSPAFLDIIGCSFDHHGNLWVVDGVDGQLQELSAAQLAASSTDIEPAIIIIMFDLSAPNFVTFDKAGNAWVDGETSDTVGEFSASQLTSSGPKTPAVEIFNSGTANLIGPGQIAFDKKGNLWVTNIGADTIVEYPRSQLASGNPSASVTLSGVVHNPWGLAFDPQGNLVVMSYANGAIEKYTKKELKTTGSPTPKVTLTGSPTLGYQIIFGPAS